MRVFQGHILVLPPQTIQLGDDAAMGETVRGVGQEVNPAIRGAAGRIGGRAAEPAQGRTGIGCDRGERLLDLVRDRGGKLARRRQAVHPGDLGQLRPRRQFGPAHAAGLHRQRDDDDGLHHQRDEEQQERPAPLQDARLVRGGGGRHEPGEHERGCDQPRSEPGDVGTEAHRRSGAVAPRRRAHSVRTDSEGALILLDAYPDRRTGVHPGSSPGQAFAGICAGERCRGNMPMPCLRRSHDAVSTTDLQRYLTYSPFDE